jgi:hypothetical protein
MQKIDVRHFSEADLKGLVTNAKLALTKQLGHTLPLGQVRHHVANLFGAKSWQSLVDAVETHSSRREDAIWVGTRFVTGNGWDPKSTFQDTFAGRSEHEVYDQMASEFCAETVAEALDDIDFEAGIEVSLSELGLCDEERNKVIADQIRRLSCAEGNDIYSLLTGKEIVDIYRNVCADEEEISVKQHSDHRRPGS